MDTLCTVGVSIGIVVIVLLLVLIYSGLLHRIVIERTASPYPAMLVAYRFSTGAYSNCGAYFEHVMKFAPHHKGIGIYYDNPEQVGANERRHIDIPIDNEKQS